MTSENDWDNLPAIAITQWQAGRVLSEDDIKLIERLLKEYDGDMAAEVDIPSIGRRAFEQNGLSRFNAASDVWRAWTQIRGDDYDKLALESTVSTVGQSVRIPYILPW